MLPRKSAKTARILAVVALISLAGCQSLVQRGVIAPPGPMNYQQANAVVHDPFPQADIGPDDKSMRPPDYQNPLPEPVRNQTTTQLAPWLLSR
ncbi:MAG: membrane or secreted protein [Planctomycetota bacterium]